MLDLRFGGMVTPTKFHVIDAPDSSYRALLGRPWLHENGMVPYTLPQCLKYVKDGKQRRIPGDLKPFGTHEIHHKESQYFFSKEEMEKLKEFENVETKTIWVPKTSTSPKSFALIITNGRTFVLYAFFFTDG